MVYSAPPDSLVIHLWCFLQRKEMLKFDFGDTSLAVRGSQLYWHCSRYVASAPVIPRTPRRRMTTTSVAFFTSRLCKHSQQSQQERRSSGVLTGRSQQACAGLAGEITRSPPLSKRMFFTTQKKNKKPAIHTGGLALLLGAREHVMRNNGVEYLVRQSPSCSWRLFPLDASQLWLACLLIWGGKGWVSTTNHQVSEPFHEYIIKPAGEVSHSWSHLNVFWNTIEKSEKLVTC